MGDSFLAGSCIGTDNQSLNVLTLWRPLFPYGCSYKASSARPG